MINIGIVGCGHWALKIINEISKNKKFNLTSVVCRYQNSKLKKLKVFDTVEKMINANKIDCIYVAADPKLNLEIVNLVKDKKIPLILEKPVTDTSVNAKELKKIVINNNLIVYPNITNYFSETYKELKNLVDNNFLKIKEIIIYEGNFGPFRKNINPIWDWGYHSISLLFLLFDYKNFSDVTKKEIKSNNIHGKGIVTKFYFQINSNINVKIITGNLFKKKIRKIKIILNNNEYILNDMIFHEINFNNNKIFKNQKTPISSLLNTFEKSIKTNDLEISKKLIDVSCSTTKFLDKYYKC
tara:strand:- start:192 stop:1085 length:894 start_codon:yes stop_codon:yes gene_type:complete